MADESRALLTRIMQGEQLEASDIDSLLARQVDEDLHLDYKHGDELKDSRKASRTVRQYASGFANSDGGVLIIGIDAPESKSTPWVVTGAIPPGGTPLDDWAARCLTPIATQFSPSPRLQVVAHKDGNILIIGVERSLNLVSVVEDGKAVYFIRHHDQTFPANDWLLADLVLGRRQHPILNVANTRVISLKHTGPDRYDSVTLGLSLGFLVENASLAWSDQTTVGIVAYESGDSGDLRPSEHLSQYLDVLPLEPMRKPELWNLWHRKIGGAVTLDPFSRHSFDSRLSVQFQYLLLRDSGEFTFPTGGGYFWKAALYVLAKNSPPRWYQITLEVSSNLIGPILTEKVEHGDEYATRFIKSEPITTGRAVVGLPDMRA